MVNLISKLLGVSEINDLKTNYTKFDEINF